MQWLFGLPILLICLRPNIKNILGCLIVYLTSCLYLSNKRKTSIITPPIYKLFVKPRKKKLCSFIMTIIILAITFYTSWSPSSKVALVASLFHLSTHTFLLLVSIFLFICSYTSLVILLYIFPIHKFRIENLQADAYCDSIGLKRHIFLFVTAVLVITICSKSSPLYPLNDWVDSNCFFTVGKSMLSGLVPYRDLMEQKGPILYALHALAALVSYRSFFGVWIIEIICCYGFLVYAYKTLLLFNKKTPVYLIPIIASILYISSSFAHGDSAEELCLPLLAYALYVGIKSILKNQFPSIKESLAIGLTSSLVLWIKYTMLGFYIGWIIVPFIVSLKNKEFKPLIKMTAVIFTGVVIVSIPVILYFAYNNALKDLWEVYFYNNMTSYSNVAVSNPISIIKQNLLRGFANFKTYNLLSIITVFIITCFTKFDNKKIPAFILSTSAFLFLSVYIGGRSYVYYSFIFSIYLPLLLTLFDLKNILNAKQKSPNKTNNSFLVVISLLMCCFISFFSQNIYLMLKPKSELPQYKFKTTIEESEIENPTLLNYGFLDGGFYTATGIVPNTKYFCTLNIDSNKIKNEQLQCIEDGIVDFVVIRNNEPMNFPGYTQVDQAVLYFEGEDRTYRLYQRNG